MSFLKKQQNLNISKIAFGLCIATFLLIGILIRISSVSVWSMWPDHLLYNGEPLSHTVDGYYYLAIAQDILNNNYDEIDTRRAYPEGLERKPLPALLSIFVAGVSRLTGLSLLWSSALIPIFLGLTLTIPVYYFSKSIGGKWAGAISVLIVSASTMYAGRTSFSALDTDCLNVSFATLIAYLIYRFSEEKTFLKYYYFTSALLCYFIFLWWWDTAQSVVTLFFLIPFLSAVVFYFRANFRETTIFLGIVLSSFTLLLITSRTLLTNLINQIISFVNYITDKSTSLFPSSAASNQEQQVSAFTDITRITNHDWPLFFLCIIGLILLCLYRRKELLFLIPLFAVGLLGIFFAIRFKIFLTPIIAISISYAIVTIYNRIRWKRILLLLLTVSFGTHIAVSLQTGVNRKSFFPSNTIFGMHQLSYILPKDAIIWNFWDYGHPLVFWAQRPTVADGYIHEPERVYLTTLPLTSADYRFSANFINFYIHHGITGVHDFLDLTNKDYPTGINLLRTVLSAGPDKIENFLEDLPADLSPQNRVPKDLVNFLFPPQNKPIYLYLDNRLLKSYFQLWVYWFGTWDTKELTGDTPLFPFLISHKASNKYTLGDSPEFLVNWDTGSLKFPSFIKDEIMLSEISVDTGSSIKNYFFTQGENSIQKISYNSKMKTVSNVKHIYSDTGSYALHFFHGMDKAILMDRKHINSLMNHLFLRNKEIPSNYFKQVPLTDTNVKIWEVRSDCYKKQDSTE